MDTTPAQTIIQQIQPQCDALHLNMKREKDLQGKTNRGMADTTGVPLSTTAKFFSGALTNPSVFMVAAMSIDLGMSLDELMGIKVDTQSSDAETIRELERKLERAEHDLKQSEVLNRYFADGIKERKTLLYGMTVLCSVLVLSLMTYFVMDVSNLNFGFVTTEGISFFGVVLLVVMLAAAGFVIYSVAKKKKKNDKSDTETR